MIEANYLSYLRILLATARTCDQPKFAKDQHPSSLPPPSIATPVRVPPHTVAIAGNKVWDKGFYQET
jgi:hypothetical protein